MSAEIITTQIIDPHEAIFLQSRAHMDFAIVDEYARMMQDGVEFDACSGIDDAGTLYIYDGYHRGKAAESINALLRVSVKPGTKRDAEWLALAANTKHGLRRTNADIERVVAHALAHPRAANMSNREIARHFGVDEKTIRNHKQHAEVPQPPEPQPQPLAEDYISVEDMRALIDAHFSQDADQRREQLQQVFNQTGAGPSHVRAIEDQIASRGQCYHRVNLLNLMKDEAERLVRRAPDASDTLEKRCARCLIMAPNVFLCNTTTCNADGKHPLIEKTNESPAADIVGAREEEIEIVEIEQQQMPCGGAGLDALEVLKIERDKIGNDVGENEPIGEAVNKYWAINGIRWETMSDDDLRKVIKLAKRELTRRKGN